MSLYYSLLQAQHCIGFCGLSNSSHGPRFPPTVRSTDHVVGQWEDHLMDELGPTNGRTADGQLTTATRSDFPHFSIGQSGLRSRAQK